MSTMHYAPGEVTPEQLEQYRQKFEAAEHDYRMGVTAYLRACENMVHLERELNKREGVYEWATHGMVRVAEEDEAK